MQGVASVGGIVTGIDVDSIISKLAAVDQATITRYQNQQAVLRSRQSAYQEVNTRLSALKDAASKLSQSSFFNARSATISNTSYATAAANADATPGDYTVTVNALAQAHQRISQSYADVNATTVGTGNITITAAGQTTSINVTSSNNTLSGLRDAINAANTNVRASIVQDSDSSYRLMVFSKNTGTANAMTMSASLTGGAAPAFTDLQVAQDASVTLGTGSTAITTTRSSNSLRDLLPGVTLNLSTASIGQTFTVSVGQDTDTIQKAAQAFVDQYNNVLDYINTQSKFNSDTNKGGVLIGDSTLRSIQSEVQTLFSGAVTGLTGSITSLTDIGISTGGDGKLTLDAAEFTDKLTSDPTSVARLFSLTGQSTNAGVRFLTASENTKVAGTAWAVNITQVATQTRVTAGVQQTGNLTADETLTINGVSVSLTAGMDRAAVATAINSRSAQTGVTASFTDASGTGTGSYLTLKSASYGSAPTISVVSSLSNAATGNTGVGNVAATQAAPGGESGAGTGAAGLDVAGTINGEAATGTGQMLTGAVGNANTEGVRLQITSQATGSLGTVSVYGGSAYTAARSLTRLTDSTTGAVSTERSSLDQRIQDIQDIIDRRNDEITRRNDSLRAKFNTMEALIGQLQSQSSFLTAQLGNNSSNKNG